MERAHTRAMAQGAESIELRVYAFNKPALHFYQGLGYGTVSHQKGKLLNMPQPGREDG